MSTKLRRLAANGVLLAVSATAACGAGEIFLRFARPQPLQAAYVWEDGTLRHLPSRTIRYARSEFSNDVVFNADGFRGREIPRLKERGRPRVLLMGDSFVEGKQVAEDQVLSSVLEEEAGASGLPLEVINLGVAGYGTSEELILWERFARSLDPDLVILGFYPNDVRNNADRGLFEAREGRIVQVKEPRTPRRRWSYDLRKALASRSHLYMLWVDGMRSWRKRAEGRRGGGGSAVIDENRPLEAEEVFARRPSAEVEEGWGLTLGLVEELRARVEGAGAGFLVVLFPTRYQVDDSLWAAHARARGIRPEGIDLRTPQRIFGEWSDRTGIRVLDLLDEFRARNVDNSFYHDRDAHWNPEGHRLAATLIREALPGI